MSPEMLISVRELHSRRNDGVHVRMLWCQQSGRVFITVNDDRSGEAFAVEVPEGKEPLEVFNHPYAFAA
jgi:hypothetical protein